MFSKTFLREKHKWFANDFAEVFRDRRPRSCVGWTRGCDGVPGVSHTSPGLRFGGVGVPAVPNSIVVADSRGMILLHSWA